MKDIFNKWYVFLLELEGSATDDPDDAGGYTEFGLSERFLKSHNLPRPKTAEEARPIYEKYFFYDHKFDLLPRKIACYAFLMGVLVGPQFVVRLLQKVVRVPADGKLGPITLGAIKSMNEKFLLEMLAAHMCDHLLNVSNFRWGRNKKFLIGWLRRNLVVFDYAINEKWKY
jgi:lysozyme family protein